MVRDSLGIELVESYSPAHPAASPVQLGTSPLLEVGGEEGELGHDLFRVVGAVRFADGGVGIANASTSEVRLFDAEGRYEGAAGGVGDGPGELRALGPVVLLPHDQFMVLEARRGRLIRFDRGGRLISDERSAPEGAAMFVEQNILMRDGTRVIRGYEPDAVSHEVRGPQRTSSPILMIPPAGPVDTLAVWPGRDILYLDVAQPTGAPLGRATVIRPLFAPETVIAADAVAGVWIVGDQRTPYFQVRDAGGRLVRHVRWVPDARGTGDQELRMLLEEHIAGLPGDPGVVARAVDEFHDGSTPPVFRRAAVDRAGRVWLKRYPLPSDEQQVWWIFDEDGRWLGDLATPQPIDPLEIGPDYIVLRVRDELDVERVVVLSLTWFDA